jgi:hypothetical protein
MLWLMAVPVRRVRVGFSIVSTMLSKDTFLTHRELWFDMARFEKTDLIHPLCPSCRFLDDAIA